MAILKKLFAYAGNHKYLTMLSLFLSFISAILLLMPFVWIWKVIQVILDVYPNFSLASDAARYGWYAFTFAVVGILVYVLSLICSHLAAFRIAANMRKDAMHHVMKLPMGYLSKEGSGKVRKIIDESAASTETYLAQSMKQYMDALEEMSNEAVEYIRGIPVVKTFQQTVFSFERFHKSIKNYEKFSVGYTNKLRRPMTGFTSFVNSIFIFLIGSMMILVLNGFNVSSLLPDFMFYVIFTPILAVTTNKIMFASENTMLAEDALNRIESITKKEIVKYPQTSQKLSNYNIKFNNVSFTYPDTDVEVLHNINLDIKSGTTVAFVGKSGGGKSTLVSLIPRFYDVTKGSIEIGGVNLKDMNEKDLMDKISFVFQDNKLLKKSLYENIKMGFDVDKNDVLDALHKAQCDDIIAKFSTGLDTKIGTEGVYLSGGETQRMTLARAIVKNAPILLLDEATAYADSDNEYLMQKAILELSKNKTTIMIAHRLSTIVNVDCIYVVDDGKIIESGTHKELIANDGLYAEMWSQYRQSVDWKVGEFVCY